MDILDEQQIGDRRVRLIALKRGGHAVVIEVLGPNNTWVDISFQADRHLRRKAAPFRFAQRLKEQERRLRRARPEGS
jgi:hypothetical protein